MTSVASPRKSFHVNFAQIRDKSRVLMRGLGKVVNVDWDTARTKEDPLQEKERATLPTGRAALRAALGSPLSLGQREEERKAVMKGMKGSGSRWEDSGRKTV